MFQSTLLSLFFFILVALSPASRAQAPSAVLAAKIRQETGMRFTSKQHHSKTSRSWACVVLRLNSPDAGKATAIGLLTKTKVWKVEDYVIGTAMQGTIAKLIKKYPKAPKSIFPKKL